MQKNDFNQVNQHKSTSSEHQNSDMGGQRSLQPLKKQNLKRKQPDGQSIEDCNQHQSTSNEQQNLEKGEQWTLQKLEKKKLSNGISKEAFQVNQNKLETSSIEQYRKCNSSVSEVPLAQPSIAAPGIPKQKTRETWKNLTSAPTVKLFVTLDNRLKEVIEVSWSVNIQETETSITSFEVYSYSDSPSANPETRSWRQIDCCEKATLKTLLAINESMIGETYHFIVRAVDEYSRCTPFSEPTSILILREHLFMANAT